VSLSLFPNQILKVRAAVVLFHHGRLLAMRQNQKPFWVLPGGTLEEGESIAGCAIRELQEEANLQVELVGLLSLSEFSDAKRHVVDVTFLARLISGETTWVPPFPENIDAIEWVSREAFETTTLKPDALQALILENWETLAQGQIPQAVYLGRQCL
jgi:ADP-ribose pyrophosphatase YjhB (NUDIX family)